MAPIKLLSGQILIVFAIVIAGVGTSTQWAVAELGYQGQLGALYAASGKQQHQLLIDGTTADSTMPVYCVYYSELQRTFAAPVAFQMYGPAVSRSMLRTFY